MVAKELGQKPPDPCLQSLGGVGRAVWKPHSFFFVHPLSFHFRGLSTVQTPGPAVVYPVGITVVEQQGLEAIHWRCDLNIWL